MKVKPLMAVAFTTLAVLVPAAAALAVPGDQAIDDSSPFRLNPYTLEPGCFTPGHRGPVDPDRHIDLTALVDGDIVQELHITVADGSPVSVDQVLVPGRYGGYSVYNTFDTGTSGTDPDVDPNQTAVDLFAPDGSGSVDMDDIVVCVSDHNDDVQNEPYIAQENDLVAAKNRPIIAPSLTCLGASAIEPLNTYKAGMGYAIQRGYVQDRFTALFGITDPNAIDANGDGVPDFVRLNPREDGPYDARRVNDVDSFGEEFAGLQDDYGQTRKFSLAGDPTAWTLSNADDPDTLSNLITFTTQGDLPLSWTLRASLAQASSERMASLSDDMLRAWEASWQAYYDGAGAKPSMLLCPGTNSPAPDTDVVVNLPEAAAPPAQGQTTVVTREVTTIQTVAGPATVVKAKKAAKSSKAKAKAKRKAACVRKANAKKSKKARKKARARCRKL